MFPNKGKKGLSELQVWCFELLCTSRDDLSIYLLWRKAGFVFDVKEDSFDPDRFWVQESHGRISPKHERHIPCCFLDNATTHTSFHHFWISVFVKSIHCEIHRGHKLVYLSCELFSSCSRNTSNSCTNFKIDLNEFLNLPCMISGIWVFAYWALSAINRLVK